ncbi:MAG: hypothetical protein J7619_12880 [Dyadobacter sp.]|uniref:hypothetical protein n=1 Tax=Dyadobacter sp. TaxID=1914288 RepID=UPI001B0532CD|nr:hypothetical protein [Dyadobacter sp.]MBO9613589.1 hypothetical protein [Dyadobacter sp.]
MFELMKVCFCRSVIGLRQIDFQEILLKMEFGGVLQMLAGKVGKLPTFVLFCNTNYAGGAASNKHIAAS